MKRKIISALGIAVIAACLAGCASNEPEPEKENPYKKRATEIVTNSSYEVSGATATELYSK